jgi:TonB family protein
VLKDGSVGNVEVFEGVHPLLDEEAVRVVKTFDRWMPGVMDGEKVSVAFNLPIRFRLVEEG